MYHEIYNLRSKGQCKNFHQEAKTARHRATLPKGKQKFCSNGSPIITITCLQTCKNSHVVRKKISLCFRIYTQLLSQYKAYHSVMSKIERWDTRYY
jgi:hypothetical protein